MTEKHFFSGLLLPYQQRWVRDRSQVKVFEKSRQIGITWTEAFDAVCRAAQRENGESTYYTSYRAEFAKEFIDHCADWACRLDAKVEPVEGNVIRDRDKDVLSYRINFSSGNYIMALSSNPTNLRGHKRPERGRLRVIIDEAAHHPDLYEVLKAAMGVTIWGGRLHMISTHQGAENPFNEIVNDIRAGRLDYSLHRVTLDDALAEGLFKRICEIDQKTWSPEAEAAWRTALFNRYPGADEELLCIPARDTGAYLPTSLIQARMHPEIPVLRWELKADFSQKTEADRMNAADTWCKEQIDPYLHRLKPDLMSFFGEDFGRSSDLTVIWPMQLEPSSLMRRTPFIVELRNVPFHQQAQVLFYLAHKLPRFTAAAMDKGGNGAYLAEQAYFKFGSRVEPIDFSVDWYREFMPKYRSGFEEGKLELPDDRDILADHRAIKLEHGVARVPETRVKGQDGRMRHGDSAIAGALSWYATLKALGYSYAYQSGQTAEATHSGRRTAVPNRYSKYVEDRDAWDDLPPRARGISPHGLRKGYVY